MKNVIACILILATILVLGACGAKDDYAEAKAAQEAYENMKGIADKAKDDYDKTMDLLDIIRGD